jgi:hypothetical protein
MSTTLHVQRLILEMRPCPYCYLLLRLKLFGNLFLGQPGQAEGSVGELVVECLKTDRGEDDVVDAVEVAAVAGGHDSPVLDVCDGLCYDEAYCGDLGVEPVMVVGELPGGIFFEGGDPVDTLVSGIADQSTGTGENSRQSCFVEAAFVVPAAGECFTAGIDASVDVADDLDVDAVAFAVPECRSRGGASCMSVPGCLDEADFSGDLALQ